MNEIDPATAQTPEPQPRLLRVDGPRYLPGYESGLTQPGLLFQLSFPGKQTGRDPRLQDRLLRIDEWMRRVAPGENGLEVLVPQEPRLDHLFHWFRHLLDSHGQPVFEPPRIVRLPGYHPCRWHIVFPCMDAVPALSALRICLTALARAMDPGEEALEAGLDRMMQENARELSSQPLAGFNTLHFLKEAHALGIPWFRFSFATFQFGFGSKARWLTSSLSDVTPHISVILSKHKVATNGILRQAGLPVPEQVTVQTEEQAVAAAGRIGFPVVVKPSDREGGMGVSAGLQDSESVRKAFRDAALQSDRMIIERHVDGLDYRLHVVHGEVHGVLERSPGAVTGDGHHTVRELVRRQNEERATARDDRRHLHAIDEDDEAERMLRVAGLDWDDVPEEGRVVRLRAVSNVARGGIPRELSLEEIHPANRALAVRAARILRLDIAGVDLLMPDIRRPWTPDTAGICEVNAQPQMFTTQHAATLRAIMSASRGRIPVIVVLGGSDEFRTALYDRVLARHPGAGMVSGGAIRLAGEPDVGITESFFAGARALIIDGALDALVLSVVAHRELASGWPVDRCDVILVAGDEGRAAAEPDIRRLCLSARHLSPRRVLIDRDDASCLAASRELDWLSAGSGDGTVQRVTRARMIDSVLDLLPAGAD